MPDSAGGVETLCGGGEPERSDSLRTFGEVVVRCIKADLAA